MSSKFKSNCIFKRKFFTRERVLSFPSVVSFIINFARRSLQIELNAFSDLLEKPDVSKQAFSQARQKLSPKAFTMLNEKLITETYSDNDIKTFKGLRVLAVDGSTIRLPVSDELYKEYGAITTANSIPMARASVLFDVLNDVAIHAVLRRCFTSERDMAIEHMKVLCRLDSSIINGNHTGDLIIYDRGYPSVFSFFFHQKKKKHFLMRCNNTHFIAETKTILESGLRDVVITIPAYKASYHSQDFKKYLPKMKKNATMQIRVLVFDLSSGEKEVIVTSLLDQELFTYDDIRKLYNMRWGIEENYKFYKAIAEIENFSGKSKLVIEQDFYATIFACNIASLLAQEALDELKEEEVLTQMQAKPRKYAFKINRNVLIGTMKNEIIHILLSDLDLDEYCQKIKVRIKRSLVSIRPDRRYPRKHHYGKQLPKIRRAL